MKKIIVLCALLATVTIFAASDDEATTLVKVGQPAPEFKLTTLNGKPFDLNQAKGRVVLVNFFATWCGPCMAEMPHLQDQIWDRFQGTNFVMIAIDREETEQVVTDFQKKRNFPFPIACDPKRAVYSKFATQYIPRNFVINHDGIVVYQSMGYSETEFATLVAAIQKEITKTP